jgi:hypothetical protein
LSYGVVKCPSETRLLAWLVGSVTAYAVFTPVSDEDQTCSFCGRRRAEVRRLIPGPTHQEKHPSGLNICDGCVTICNEILEKDLGADWRYPEGRGRD